MIYNLHYSVTVFPPLIIISTQLFTLSCSVYTFATSVFLPFYISRSVISSFTLFLHPHSFAFFFPTSAYPHSYLPILVQYTLLPQQFSSLLIHDYPFVTPLPSLPHLITSTQLFTFQCSLSTFTSAVFLPSHPESAVNQALPATTFLPLNSPRRGSLHLPWRGAPRT